MRNDAQDLAKMSNDMCGHKERLLYESKTASKRNDKTGSDTPVNTMAQMGYSHRGIVMKE